MSTKIYTGFKIASNMPFYVLHQQLMDFRAEIAKEVERKALQTLITISVFDMDKRVIGLDDGPTISAKDSVYAAYRYIRDRQREIKKTQMRDPILDWSFEMTFHPLACGKILGITYTEQPDFQQAWLDKWFVEEYFYFDNTDKPEAITDADWEQRERDWEEALPGVIAPSMAGFTATISTLDMPFASLQLIQSNWPTIEERAHDMTKEVMYRVYYVKGYNKYETWVNSPDGQQVYQRLYECIKERLPPTTWE